MSPSFVVPPWAQPRACYPMLVTPPSEEPITVVKAKLLAAMTWALTTPPDPRDQMMAEFITAARSKVEQDTGLALLTQTWELHVLEASEVIPLPSQCTPTQSVEDVTPGVGVTRRARTIRLRSDARAVALSTPMTGVLRVTAGWPTPAALLQAAPLLVHAVGLLAAHYATLGRDIAITGAVASINVVPEGYEDTIAPHRLIWVT